ncbi:MAG TPA: adenylate/guanylate cyclase domain-containing protein [Anaerolineales bacterium]|nr:adenylate/guanylate cyclase domain-containing protein [Anaerolineales bacterium]
MSQSRQPNDAETMKVNSASEMWYKVLTGGEPMIGRAHHWFGFIPSNPRCKICNAPFRGFGAPLMRLMGKRPSRKNPRFCAACEDFASAHPGGAEIELSMLFVDVRGSTTLAEKMNATEFSQLMNRFYEEAINVLVRADALIDKLVGDEVTALFIPGYAGKDHARRAADAGQDLLHAMGYGQSGEAWVPIGVGVHTGVAWVGSIKGAGAASMDFTALGDNVNIAARLASKAGAGEVLISDAACNSAGIETEGLERRELELKGKSELVSVRVLRAQ